MGLKRPKRTSSEDVAAAVMACSSPVTGKKFKWKSVMGRRFSELGGDCAVVEGFGMADFQSGFAGARRGRMRLARHAGASIRVKGVFWNLEHIAKINKKQVEEILHDIPTLSVPVKAFLYDEVLRAFKDPNTSIPTFCAFYGNSQTSRYKINWKKCEAHPITRTITKASFYGYDMRCP
ncbi:hypothetical protein NDU88_002221 [Pleurodeles waltl]|uniref:Uncharacterized protein n=1 Tax=Pleurodeles waltl TaxID=8319 RepID=A0AAV7M1S1_PLEWA|nr:hypothetical protein NDU88_002221 [Pleurodeles waltl]